MTSFHLVIAVAALLITLGLIMVLSASGVHSYDEDGSPWAIFAKQVLWTVVGLFAFYVALRTPVSFMRRLAFPGFAITIVMLVLVLIPGIGKESNGSRGWFVVAGFSMQPSELAKIAFAIWGAHLLAARRMELASVREMLFPLVPGALLALVLIVLQPDLGQTVSLGIILLGLLWYAGLPLRVFLELAGRRRDRRGHPRDVGGLSLRPRAVVAEPRVPTAWAPVIRRRQARYALANGGIFGDGLGQGTAKWNYLPNAHNDFIFAIIGEELGYVGAVGLLALFGLFAYTGMRIAKRSADPFLRLLTADRNTVGSRSGLHQRRLRRRIAAHHGAATSADFRGWNLNGDNTFHAGDHHQRGAARTGGGGGTAGGPRGPGQPPTAPAPARAVRSDPARDGARPAADATRQARPRQAEAETEGRREGEGEAQAQADVEGRFEEEAEPGPRGGGGAQARRSGCGRPHRQGLKASWRPSASIEPGGSQSGRSALRVSVSVVLAGGGTAGHIEPAMAVADALVALASGGADHRSRYCARARDATGARTRLRPGADHARPAASQTLR